MARKSNVVLYLSTSRLILLAENRCQQPADSAAALSVSAGISGGQLGNVTVFRGFAKSRFGIGNTSEEVSHIEVRQNWLKGKKGVFASSVQAIEVDVANWPNFGLGGPGVTSCTFGCLHLCSGKRLAFPKPNVCLASMGLLSLVGEVKRNPDGVLFCVKPNRRASTE